MKLIKNIAIFLLLLLSLKFLSFYLSLAVFAAASFLGFGIPALVLAVFWDLLNYSPDLSLLMSFPYSLVVLLSVFVKDRIKKMVF